MAQVSQARVWLIATGLSFVAVFSLGFAAVCHQRATVAERRVEEQNKVLSAHRVHMQALASHNAAKDEEILRLCTMLKDKEDNQVCRD